MEPLLSPEELPAAEGDAEPVGEPLARCDSEPRALGVSGCETAPDAVTAALPEADADDTSDGDGAPVLEVLPEAEGSSVAAAEPVGVLLCAGDAEKAADAEALPDPDVVAPPLKVAPECVAAALCSADSEAAPLGLSTLLAVPLGEEVETPTLPVGGADAMPEGLPELLPVPAVALAEAAICRDAEAAALRECCELGEGLALPHAEPLAAPLLVPSTEAEADPEARPLGVRCDAEAEIEPHPLALLVRAAVAVAEPQAQTLGEWDAKGEMLVEGELAGVLVPLLLEDAEREASTDGEPLLLHSGDVEAEGLGVALLLFCGDAEALPESEDCAEGVNASDAVEDAVPSAALAEGVLEGKALPDAAPVCVAGADGVAKKLLDSLGAALPDTSTEGEGGVLPVRGGLLLAEGQGEPLREALLLPEGVCDAHCVGAAPVALPLSLELPNPLREALVDAVAVKLVDTVASAVAVGATAEPLVAWDGVPVELSEVPGVRDAAAEAEASREAEEFSVAAIEVEGVAQFDARKEGDGAPLPDGDAEAALESDACGVSLAVAVAESDSPGERLSILLAVARAVSEGEKDAKGECDGEAEGVGDDCGADAVPVAQAVANTDGEEAGDNVNEVLPLALAVLCGDAEGEPVALAALLSDAEVDREGERETLPVAQPLSLAVPPPDPVGFAALGEDCALSDEAPVAEGGAEGDAHAVGAGEPLPSALREGGVDAVCGAVMDAAKRDAEGGALRGAGTLRVARAEGVEGAVGEAHAVAVGLPELHSEKPADRDCAALPEAAKERLALADGESLTLAGPLALAFSVAAGEALPQPELLPLYRPVALAEGHSDEEMVGRAERELLPDAEKVRDGAPLPDCCPDKEAQVLAEARGDSRELIEGLREAAEERDALTD